MSEHKVISIRMAGCAGSAPFTLLATLDCGHKLPWKHGDPYVVECEPCGWVEALNALVPAAAPPERAR